MIQHFLSHLNYMKTTIKFTVEVENKNRISFLDADIMHHSDGSLSTAVYRKKTHTEKIWHMIPTIQPHIKWLLLKTLFTRAEKICSTNIKKEEEREHIWNLLKANGYSLHIINRNYSIVPKQPATSKIEPKATVIIPYIRHLLEGIRRILSKANIRTCFKPHHTLRGFGSPKGSHYTITEEWGGIQIQCGSCNDTSFT